jgi:hypothetical protein
LGKQHFIPSRKTASHLATTSGPELQATKTRPLHTDGNVPRKEADQFFFHLKFLQMQERYFRTNYTPSLHNAYRKTAAAFRLQS